MSKFSRRAKLAVAGAVVMTVLGGGVAFAFWSSSGSGAGTGSTSSGASSLTVTQAGAPTDLAPGVAAGTISGTVKNTATNNAYVNTVTVAIASVTKAANAAAGTCDASDYALSNAVMAVNTDLTPGQTVSFTGATLGFHNKASNQDACKGATVNLAYSTN